MTRSLVNSQENDSTYAYFAFISYKSEDSKWALWLKKQLQAYRLPLATHQNYRDVPVRCYPIFLDKTNLTPGNLEAGLRAEVQASKFLIVICSRNARDNPKYLDDELSYFINGTGSPKRVIPFIVEPSESVMETCFPPGLASLCKENVIETVDANALGRRHSVLRLISIMLGIRPDELEKDDKRRRRSRLAVASFFAIMLIAACIRLFDFCRLKTEYYLDYTEVFGMPKGIHPITEADLSGMYRYYIFEQSQGLVRQVTRKEGAGEIKNTTLFTNNSPSVNGSYEDEFSEVKYTCLNPEPRPLISRYKYNEDRSLKLVEYICDAGGDIALQKEYVNRQVVDLKYYGDSDLVIDPQIVRMLLEYDSDGYLIEMRYVDDIRKNHAFTDAKGIAGIRYDRDVSGRPTGLWYLENTGGNAEFSQTYRLTVDTNGVQGWEYGYSESDDMSYALCIGKDTTPAPSPEGYCELVTDYDDLHNLIQISLLKFDGTPYTLPDGYARMTLEYGTEGEIQRHCFFTADGAPAILKTGGYVSYRSMYKNDRENRREYFGIDEAPITTTWGFHAYAYDNETIKGPEGENAIEIVYFFDINNEPAQCVFGYAARKQINDEHHLLIHESYYGLDGEPVCDFRGAASFTQEFDKWGCLVRKHYFGLDGRPTLIDREPKDTFVTHYSTWEIRYNQRGQKEYESFYGIDDEPILNEFRFFRSRYVYDSQGRQTGVL